MPDEKPAEWKDSQNQTWQVFLTLENVRKIKKLTGLDLLRQNVAGDVAELLVERDKLADIVWIVSEDEAKLKGLSQDDFFGLIDGPAMASSWEALAVAYENFCHPSCRASVRKAIETQVETMEAAGRAMVAAMESKTTKEAIEKAITDAVAEAERQIKAFGN